MSAKIDPITRSVVQHRLSSIVKEMGEAMLRTSYSQILNSSRDFSLAICDTRGRLIAQADHLPVHVGALPWATLAVEERFKDVEPGDVFLLNDPYFGGSHLPDLTAFVPVFDGDKRLLWTIVRAHQSDIGGATHGAYNPGATEIWQEGLRIPPIRLSEAGRPREDMLDMLALNVRNPREFRGDLAAMLGAAHLGERRVSKLFSEFGASVVEAAIEAILDATEAQTRAVVSTWKDGVFHGEAFLDDDGHGRTDIRIAAKVTKKGSDVEVDLSQSDPQSTSFVNSSHANMQAAVAMAFAYLIDAEIPKNTGALRAAEGDRQARHDRLGRSGPAGDAVHQPSLQRDRRSDRQGDVGLLSGARDGRMEPQVPDRDPGRRPANRTRISSGTCFRRARAAAHRPAATAGRRSANGTRSAVSNSAASKWPRRAFPCTSAAMNSAPGSGGDGQFRGGLGVALDLVLETEKPARGNTAGDGARHGPCGMLGGEDGEPHHYRLLSEGREPRVLRTKEVGIELHPGDCLEIRSSGGGGWGPPSKRSAEARRRDAEQGLTSAEPA